MKYRPGPCAGASAGFSTSMNLHLLADLLEIAQRLLLDRRQAAGDVALGRLDSDRSCGLVRFDHVLLVVVERRA